MTMKMVLVRVMVIAMTVMLFWHHWMMMVMDKLDVKETVMTMMYIQEWVLQFDDAERCLTDVDNDGWEIQHPRPV